MRTQRQLKVGEEIRHALAMAFERGHVPWPADFHPPIITVSEVQISPDLRNATVFFTVIATADKASGPETAKALRHLEGHFRHELAGTVRLRYVPNLAFKLDTSFDYASNIDRLLSDPVVAKDLAADKPEPLAESFEDEEG